MGNEHSVVTELEKFLGWPKPSHYAGQRRRRLLSILYGYCPPNPAPRPERVISSPC